MTIFTSDHSTLQPFNVAGTDIRFGATDDGTPYTVAADFAKAMGYRQTKNALDLLDEDEKGFALTETLGGPQRLAVIYEDGMWELIFRSSLPGAKAIKKRVKDILRQIRETGSYSADKPMTELELAYRYIAVLEREQALTTENAQLTEKVAELGAKAEGYDDLIAAEGYLDLGAAAKVLAPATGGIGRTRFFNLLRGMGIIMQNSALPYQQLIDRGYFAVRTEIASGNAHPYTVVTAKGLRWLHAELREDRPTLDHGNAKQLPAGAIEAAEGE